MLKKIQHLFVKTVDAVEGSKSPFSRYYFLFAAILAVRLALEFFSSRRLFTLDDILHIGLWFIFIVLAFLVQLQLFSGEKISKVARLVIVFFSIALTAPIIDLLLTGGVGAKMNYLSLHSWKDVAWSYITVGGSSLSRGATPGIRIEIALLIIASFNYVRTKTGSLFKGIVAALSIYTVLFLSGAVPLLLGLLISGLHLQYQPDDQSTLLLLLTLDIFLLLFAFMQHSPKKVYQVLSCVPWAGVVTALLQFTIGILLARKNYPENWSLNPTTVFWFPLLLLLVICILMYAGIQKLQQQPGNTYLVKTGNGIVLLLFIISCIIRDRTFFTVALFWGILFLLNDAVLELKRIPVLRNILYSILLLAAAFTGFCTFGAPMIGFPTAWLFALLTAVFLASTFAELGLTHNGLFALLSKDAAKALLYGKLICIALVLLAFIATIRLLPGHTHVLFILVALPPALTIWFKPGKTLYTALSFIPAYLLLIFYFYI